MIEYLSKKGYSKTEATLRAEGANQDAEGNVIHARAEDRGGPKYSVAFGKRSRTTSGRDRPADLLLELLTRWIEENLDIHKVDACLLYIATSNSMQG